MIDASTESLVSFAEAITGLPRRRGNKKPHVSTIYRWAQRGIRGIRLEAIQIGGTRCTSREALQRFFNRLAECGSHPEPQSLPARNRAAEQADAELAKAGW